MATDATRKKHGMGRIFSSRPKGKVLFRALSVLRPWPPIRISGIPAEQQRVARGAHSLNGEIYEQED